MKVTAYEFSISFCEVHQFLRYYPKIRNFRLLPQQFEEWGKIVVPEYVTRCHTQCIYISSLIMNLEATRKLTIVRNTTKTHSPLIYNCRMYKFSHRHFRQHFLAYSLRRTLLLSTVSLMNTASPIWPSYDYNYELLLFYKKMKYILMVYLWLV